MCAGAARAARRSIEATARELRYQFFTEAARRLGATVVATGHTVDDQAETVLLRLLRGDRQPGRFRNPLAAWRSSSGPSSPAGGTIFAST